MEQKIHILIVDDNSVSRIAAQSVLTDLPVRVVLAESGEKALDILEKEPVDVIFMDILMPGMDGIETTQHIRTMNSEKKNVKIIATSGTKVENREQYLQEYKFDEIIMKPLNIIEIEECFQRWFSLSRDGDTGKNHNIDIQEDKQFSSYFEGIRGLKLDEGLKYAHNSIECYMRVMKTSLKQLKEVSKSLDKMFFMSNYRQVYLQLHSIKSVFFYLGASDLGTETNHYEAMFKQEKEIISNFNTYKKRLQDFQVFIQRITAFSSELEHAMEAYYSNIKVERDITNETTGSKEEINQLIESITLHVYRFEYVEIMNGLKTLEKIVNSNCRSYLSEAIAATEEFDYDKVKAMLIGCWNEVNEE